MPTATLSLVGVPDLRGKTLPDAQNILAASGMKLVTGAYVNDASVPKDAVVQQEPAPGTQVQASQPVTVNLSLGPAAAPTQPAAQPPANPAPAPSNPPGHGNGKTKGHGKKGGN
jgi:beta-lactam-binding protein with PASTA domain